MHSVCRSNIKDDHLRCELAKWVSRYTGAYYCVGECRRFKIRPWGQGQSETSILRPQTSERR